MRLGLSLAITRGGRVVAPPFPQASGGIETVIEQDGKFYRVHTFLEDGALTVTRGGQFEYLVVAGGGGGGTFGGGGGGAGGVIVDDAEISVGSYPVVIGAGGSGTDDIDVFGENGQDTTFFGLTAIGGGGGGNRVGFAHDGQDGGSGGGSGESNEENLASVGLALQPASASGGLGFDGGRGGGSGSGENRVGGGGGGAGGVGQTADLGDVTVAGDGGAGVESDISGSSLFYAGGGGGGTRVSGTPGDGGNGVGGDGESGSATGHSGESNTGSGGGGTGENGLGGAGGSGIVIVRYRIAELEPYEQILIAAQKAGALAVYNPDDPTTLDTREDGSELFAEELRDGLGNLPPLKQTDAAQQIQVVESSSVRKVFRQAVNNGFMETAEFDAGISQPNTVMVLLRYSVAGIRAHITDSGELGGRQIIGQPGSGWAGRRSFWAGGASIAATTSDYTTDYELWHVNFDSTSSELYVDGVLDHRVNAGTNGMGGLRVFADEAGGNAMPIGSNLGPVIIFPSETLKSNADLAALRAVINANYPIGESS